MKPRHLGYFNALETVDFQDRVFGDQITSIVAMIYEKFNNNELNSRNLNSSQEIKLLTDLIFRNKGMRVKFVTDSEIAAVLPFYPNKNFSMLDSFFRGNFTIKGQEEIIKNAAGRKGTVDLKKGKLGGVFSEGTSILYINFYVLKKTFSLSPSEVAACMIHELGHIWTACEYSDRFTRTNQVLAEASREIFKKNGKKNLDYIFKELKSVNKDVTIEEVDSIVNGDRIVGGVKWHKFLIDTVISEVRNDKYNENSFEQMSDSFASRHGYGKELVMALDKLHTTFGSAEKFAVIRSMQYISELISVIFMPFMIVASITVMPILAILLSIIYVTALYGSGDNGKYGAYDELKQRYIRIRAELITLLKDQNIPTDVVASTVEQIKTIDLAVNETVEVSGPFKIVGNLIFPSNRAAKKDIAYQQTLEALVNNNFFFASSQLKTM